MTITDAINPHNSNQDFLSKLGSSNSLFPCVWGGVGGWVVSLKTQTRSVFQGSFLFNFETFFNKTTHALADTLNPHMQHM